MSLWNATAPRRSPLLLLAFLLPVLVVINASNWFIFSRVSRSVDEELGLRLTTVASAAVTTATPELLLAPDVAEDAFVRGVLEEIAERHELADLFLVDPEGVVRFDLRGGEIGARNPFLDLDFVAFTKATAGIPAASPSLRVDGVALKAGYAPVENWDGSVEAVLGVAAGGGFFSAIPALRRTLMGVTIGTGAIVVVLGAVFFGMTRRLTRTEAALSRAETLGAMGMMAAGVAHEIRNPLAIISGTASRLKKKYDSQRDPLFDFIPEEVERLNGIVEGYLRFARDEPLRFVDCDLAAVVDRTVQLVREEFEENRVTIRHSRAGAIPTRADPQRIQQVVLNLFLNSAQAMPDGGSLEVAVTREGKRGTIRVTDSGSGFEAKELADAFQPFYTTKEKGSGLGLALAKRIVEGHGGTIAVANTRAGGAEVTIELPLSDGREPEGK